MIKNSIFKLANYFTISRLILNLGILIIKHLREEGWISSVFKKLPIDKSGNELPG